MTDENDTEHPGAIAALNAKATAQGTNFFFDDPINIRRALIAKRDHGGADTPAGHTYSNIIQILDVWPEHEDHAWATHPSQTLAGKMNYQIARLERINAGL